jgi:hypothetical protein
MKSRKEKVGIVESFAFNPNIQDKVCAKIFENIWSWNYYCKIRKIQEEILRETFFK